MEMSLPIGEPVPNGLYGAHYNPAAVTLREDEFGNNKIVTWERSRFLVPLPRSLGYRRGLQPEYIEVEGLATDLADNPLFASMFNMTREELMEEVQRRARHSIPVIDSYGILLMPLLPGYIAEEPFPIPQEYDGLLGSIMNRDIGNYGDSARDMENVAQSFELLRLLDGLHVDTSYLVRRLSRVHQRYRYPLLANMDIPLLFPSAFLDLVDFRRYLGAQKIAANESLDNLESLDALYERRLSVNPSLGWFFTPDGYYEYRQRRHNWLYRSLVPVVSNYSGMTNVLAGICNNLYLDGQQFAYRQSGENTSTPAILSTGVANTVAPQPANRFERQDPVKKVNDVEIPAAIQGVLERFNRNASGGVTERVLLAGGFAVTKGDYDLFVLNGDVELAREIYEILNPPLFDETLGGERPTFPVRVQGSVITIDGPNKIQIIVASDLNSVDDVLFSFDFSHAQIAYNGFEYITTPEFQTFTMAACTYLTKPVTRKSRILKMMSVGYPILHLHTQLYIIPEYDFTVESLRVFDEVDWDTFLPGGFDFMFTIYRGGDAGPFNNAILSGSTIHPEFPIDLPRPVGASVYYLWHHAVYMNENGIGVGYYPIEQDQSYFVEYDRVGRDLYRISLIRPVYTPPVEEEIVIIRR